MSDDTVYILLALAIPVALIVGLVLGAVNGELGRRLIRIREFDPREHLATAWDLGHRRGLLDADLQDVADNPYREPEESP